jgi:hypothetical protein
MIEKRRRRKAAEHSGMSPHSRLAGTGRRTWAPTIDVVVAQSHSRRWLMPMGGSPP